MRQPPLRRVSHRYDASATPIHTCHPCLVLNSSAGAMGGQSASQSLRHLKPGRLDCLLLRSLKTLSALLECMIIFIHKLEDPIHCSDPAAHSLQLPTSNVSFINDMKYISTLITSKF